MIKLELTERETRAILYELALIYMAASPGSNAETTIGRLSRKITKQLKAQKEKK